MRNSLILACFVGLASSKKPSGYLTGWNFGNLAARSQAEDGGLGFCKYVVWRPLSGRRTDNQPTSRPVRWLSHTLLVSMDRNCAALPGPCCTDGFRQSSASTSNPQGLRFCAGYDATGHCPRTYRDCFPGR